MDLSGIEEAVSLAERRWSGLTFHISGGEAHSPCPFEHDGTDRFTVFDDGGFWCRQCGKTGWLDDDRQRHILTPAERNAIEIRKLKRQAAEHERRLSVLEQMAKCRDHIRYHQALDQDGRRYWNGEGIYDDAIDRYMLGLCYSCPTDSEHRMSWTIPVMTKGVLVNIRHRLLTNGADRYRPHLAGLGNTLFNADNLYNGKPDVMIVEGEKKSICLSQYDLNTVGMMGKAGFPPVWASRFADKGTVYVALDPDAQEEARKIAGLFKGRGRVVTLPVKADDFFVMGGKPQEFREYMRIARKAD